MKVWKRRGTLQKAEEFSECDNKSTALHPGEGTMN